MSQVYWQNKKIETENKFIALNSENALISFNKYYHELLSIIFKVLRFKTF